MGTVAIIDYGSGNLHSAHKAFALAAREAGLDGTRIAVTADPEVVRTADRVGRPGDGAFADCRRGLDAVPGLVEAMTEAARGRARPFLGICVGMQLMATRGLEHETASGLDWIAGDVAALDPGDPGLKVPHMGWNALHPRRPTPLLDGIPTGEAGWHAYFVHGYALEAADPEDVAATTDHGGPVTALVARGTMAGTQFHPEKSQRLGLALLANFLRWSP